MSDRQRNGPARMGVSALSLLMLIGCAEPRRGIIARSELVSLDISGPPGDRVLRLDPAPGARINARLSPMLELHSGAVLTLSAAELTADSSYFVTSPQAALGATPAGSATLRASVCPSNLRVCRSVVLDVALPR